MTWGVETGMAMSSYTRLQAHFTDPDGDRRKHPEESNKNLMSGLPMTRINEEESFGPTSIHNTDTSSWLNEGTTQKKGNLGKPSSNKIYDMSFINAKPSKKEPTTTSTETKSDDAAAPQEDRATQARAARQDLMKPTFLARKATSGKRSPSTMKDSTSTFFNSPGYHTVRGKKMYGLIVDPGAAHALMGCDTLIDFICATVSRSPTGELRGRSLA